MRVIAAFAALLALAYASPTLETRQQGENCQVGHIYYNMQPAGSRV